MAELLLVDNDPRIAELIAWFLAQRGHQVRTAGSFAEARARIDERRPDLMLSDVELGAESGREELPALAREGRLPPTLVVSGYLDADLVAALTAVPGVVGTLAKPFEIGVLQERVEGALAHVRAARARGAEAPIAGPRADHEGRADRAGRAVADRDGHDRRTGWGGTLR